MHQVYFLNRAPLLCRGEKPLMAELLEGGLPVASSCSGAGICGKCKITVLEGAHHLSAPTDLEEGLASKFHLKKNERISCQCKVRGAIKINTSYW